MQVYLEKLQYSLELKQIGLSCLSTKRNFPVSLSPCGSAGKESTHNVGDLGLIPGLEKFPGERKGKILQYSCLENSMDCIVHEITKSRTRLSDFHFHSLSLPTSQGLEENLLPADPTCTWHLRAAPVRASCTQV